MGMFDYIRCEYALPEQVRGVQGWQTKDTPEQYMETYAIREDGSLWHLPWHFEVAVGAPPMPQPFSEPREYEDWARRWRSRVQDEPVRTMMTDAVCFYTEHEGVWWEFCALYRRGELLALDQVSPVVEARAAGEHGGGDA